MNQRRRGYARKNEAIDEVFAEFGGKTYHVFPEFNKAIHHESSSKVYRIYRRRAV
jgi:hypothetical protein